MDAAKIIEKINPLMAAFAKLVKEKSLLYPLGTHKNIFFVAVPNNMVLSIWGNKIKEYLEPMQRIDTDIKDIKCIVRPEYFDCVPKKERQLSRDRFETCLYSIEKIKEEFIAAGMSPEIAVRAAEIQAILDRRDV